LAVRLLCNVKRRSLVAFDLILQV